MVFPSCPRCGESVQIPAGASSVAQVRCPLCQEEYLLSEALTELPPLLLVLSDPQTDQSTGDFAMIGAATGGDDSPPAFQLDQPRPKSMSPSGSRSPVTAARRRRPRQQSVLWEMTKVVIGGVLGLAIGYVVIWWLPYGYGKDLLDVGPSIAKHVPWIVPQKFRGSAAIELDSEWNDLPATDEAARRFSLETGEEPAWQAPDDGILLQQGDDSPFEEIADDALSPSESTTGDEHGEEPTATSEHRSSEAEDHHPDQPDDDGQEGRRPGGSPADRDPPSQENRSDGVEESSADSNERESQRKPDAASQSGDSPRDEPAKSAVTPQVPDDPQQSEPTVEESSADAPADAPADTLPRDPLD